ncbi:MAG: hypothetical protein ACYC1U_10925 [Candidatus Aquicultorales bacterium]
MSYKRKLLLALGSLSVFLLGAAATAVINVTPAACAVCHQPEFEAWNSSAHKSKTGCSSCHRPDGFWGFVDGQLSTVRMFAGTVGAGDRPVRAEVDSERCEGCHRSIKLKTVRAKGLRMNHAPLMKQGVDCLDCHNEIVHGRAVPVAKRSTMDKCAPCHAEEGKTVECALCHIDPKPLRQKAGLASWSVFHGKQRLKSHGMSDPRTCSFCHRKQECGECHVEMPHPSDWPSVHGDALAAADCAKCHNASFCDSCHRTEMPHPADYLKKHSDIVRRGGRSGDLDCYNCHLKSDCQRCHERHIHPGIDIRGGVEQ